MLKLPATLTTCAATLALVLAAAAPARASGFTVDGDLNRTVPVTGADFEAYFAARGYQAMRGTGDAFALAGRTHQVNPVFLMAMAGWESAWGTSRIAAMKHNLFGYGAYDRCPYTCAYAFRNKQEGIHFVANQVKHDYLTPGGRFYGGAASLTGMNRMYSSDRDWARGINSLMNEFRAWFAQRAAAQQNTAAGTTGQPVLWQPVNVQRPQPAPTPQPAPEPAAKAQLSIHIQAVPGTPGETFDPDAPGLDAGKRVKFLVSVTNRGRKAAEGVSLGLSVDNDSLVPEWYSLWKWVIENTALKWLPLANRIVERNPGSDTPPAAFPVFVGDLEPGQTKVLVYQARAKDDAVNTVARVRAWLRHAEGLYEKAHFDSKPHNLDGRQNAGGGDVKTEFDLVIHPADAGAVAGNTDAASTVQGEAR